MSTPTRPDNAPRFVTGTDHVESWFLRANHPTSPRALWLKVTTLSRAAGGAVAEVWASLFDGDRTVAIKQTVDIAAAWFSPEGDRIRHPAAEFDLPASGGRTVGRLRNDCASISWDLQLIRPELELARPMCLLPSRRLIDARLPKNKLLTPAPLLRFGGHVCWNDEKWNITGWIGMQGHNWGTAHAPEYAWGQVVFTDALGIPQCVVEGASGRLRVGRTRSPLISMLTVRTATREYRFDRLVDLWRQTPRIAFPEWTLRMRGPDGEAALAMRGDPAQMVCLGYENPGGQLSYCLNSKTAAVTLRVNPVDDDALEFVSACGGALEFLQDQPDPRVGPCV